MVACKLASSAAGPLLVLSILLSGCASQTTRYSDGPLLPPALLQSCPDLTSLDGASGGAVLAKLTEVAAIYHECAVRHNALVDVVTPKKAP